MTRTQTAPTASAGRATDGHGAAWLSAHLHFSGNPNPMLTQFVGPFLDRARAEGRVERAFFIRYWTEGQHIRVRMLPRPGVDRRALQADFEAGAAAFFSRRRFLLPAAHLDDPQTVKRTFLAEYPQSVWDELYGPDGTMPVREPNQLLWTSYEPEFGRYGGVRGTALSERHFEESSDLVLNLLETSNLHLRSIVLGAAAQIMTAMTVALLGDERQAAAFLAGYEQRWRHGWGGLYAPAGDRFERAYAEQARVLVPRVEAVLTTTVDVVSGAAAPEGSYLRAWAWQCRTTRQLIDEAAAGGELLFPRGRDSDVWDVQRDSDASAHGLVFSYVHMLNNRLGVPIVDEIYLAYLLRRALEDLGVTAVSGAPTWG